MVGHEHQNQEDLSTSLPIQMHRETQEKPTRRLRKSVFRDEMFFPPKPHVQRCLTPKYQQGVFLMECDTFLRLNYLPRTQTCFSAVESQIVPKQVPVGQGKFLHWKLTADKNQGQVNELMTAAFSSGWTLHADTVQQAASFSLFDLQKPQGWVVRVNTR
ncbi:hypothetical protein EXN66_Car005967 [Channa argus]|uniref:Uncharacterized protein n=1 Tax=Channa argus TaxID=215402 RepID=A0A6G1PJ41_CHAAH|nr:hypothetical protein EXN66_Car005967 [Channa argus]